MKIKNIFLGLIFAAFVVSCSDDDQITVATITPTQTGTYVDQRDGQTYHYVRYGNLDWMVENSKYDLLDATKCNFYLDYEDALNEDNPPVPAVDKYSGKYGLLYTYDGALEAVPEGWRLPTDEDYQQLEVELGMSQSEAAKREWRGNEIANLLQQGNDGTSLAFRLGGYRTTNTVPSNPRYRYIGSYGFYWTATADTQKDGKYYFYRKLFYSNNAVYRESMEPDNNMLSVRFVRDAQND